MNKRFLYSLIFMIIVAGSLAACLSPALGQYRFEVSIPMTSVKKGNPATMNPGEYVKQFFIFGFYLLAFLSVGMMVIGGILYMMAGTVTKVEQAKSYILGALGGMGLLLGSYLILYTIDPSTTNLELKALDKYDIEVPAHEAQSFTEQQIKTSGVATGQYAEIINSASQKYGVDANLVKAVIMAESGGNPTAQSGAGARGLMQLMPKYFPGVNYDDPASNIDAGTKYLAYLQKRYNGDTQKILAAYNCGPNALDKKYNGQISATPSETRNYVPKVIGYYNNFANKS